MVLRKYATSIKKYPNQTYFFFFDYKIIYIDIYSYDRIVAPPEEIGSSLRGKRYEKLDSDGIISPGERISPGDIYINKQTPLNTTDALANPDKIADSGISF